MDYAQWQALKIFDAKPLPAKDPKGIAGKMGEVVSVDADGFTVVCADGRFKVTRVQPADGKKIDACEFISTAKLATGAWLTDLTPIVAGACPGYPADWMTAFSRADARPEAGMTKLEDPALISQITIG